MRQALWNEAAPPQTGGKRCARAVASLLLGLEKPFSPFSLSFRSSVRSRVQTDRVFGAQSRDNERHGITPPCSPVRVLGGGVYRGTVPGPRRGQRGCRWRAELSSTRAAPAGARSPARPARARSATGLSPSRCCSHSLPPDPGLPSSPRGLDPGERSAPQAAPAGWLPTRRPFPCKRFLWNGRAGSTGLSPSPQNLNKLGGRQGKVSNGP